MIHSEAGTFVLSYLGEMTRAFGMKSRPQEESKLHTREAYNLIMYLCHQYVLPFTVINFA